MAVAEPRPSRIARTVALEAARSRARATAGCASIFEAAAPAEKSASRTSTSSRTRRRIASAVRPKEARWKPGIEAMRSSSSAIAMVREPGPVPTDATTFARRAASTPASSARVSPWTESAPAAVRTAAATAGRRPRIRRPRLFDGAATPLRGARSGRPRSAARRRRRRRTGSTRAGTRRPCARRLTTSTIASGGTSALRTLATLRIELQRLAELEKLVHARPARRAA